ELPYAQRPGQGRRAAHAGQTVSGARAEPGHWLARAQPHASPNPPLYLGAHMSIAGGVSTALDRAGSVGSNAVQVFTKNNRQWSGPPVDPEDVARWRSQMPV